MSIIDYKPLNDKIAKIEDIIREHNNEERELIITHVLKRVRAERQKVMESDLMDRTIKGMPMGSIMKRFFKGNFGILTKKTLTVQNE